MNRQRAVKYLNALAEHFDDQNLRFIGGDIREVVSALCAPAPDPITGLVPCGCGGKPANEDFFDGFFHLSRATCPKCGIEVTTADGQAKAAWNHAMGMPEVEG